VVVASLFVAGALGACARFLVDRAVHHRRSREFPWGTVVVNVVGSFALGIVSGSAMYHGLGHLPRVAIGTGLCGAFTTFSTFSFETIRLFEEAPGLRWVTNLVGSTASGLLAAGAGLAIMAAL
jgi:CrcB protein